MNVLHIQGSFSKEHGGPLHSLTNYCLEMARRGHDVSAWVLEGFPHSSPAVRLPEPIKMVVHQVEPPAGLGRSRVLRRELRLAPTPDLFHLHGTWYRATYYGAREAKRRKVPYVFELMGMYEPYGLRTKWLRKQIARWWFQDAVLKEADCLHVNSAREAEQMRALGFKRPVAVIPVGIDLHALTQVQQRKTSLPPWPQLEGRRFFLYLSRIHEKKGIEILLDAWGKLAGQFPDVMLVIAGAGEPDYVTRCKRKAADLGLEARCLWPGRINEEEKSWALTQADLFVLPSFSENFGNTIPEAMAHGTAVLTTDATPWQEVEKRQAGWITSPRSEALAETLEEALRHEPAHLKKMGLRGRQWVEESFALSKVIDALEALYGWLIGTQTKPSFVLTK